MLDLIDFSSIIEQHYRNLRKDSNRINVVILFFIIPAFISLILVSWNFVLNTEAINGLLVAFTIFTAILPNVIVIQVGIRKDLKDNNTFSEDALNVSNNLYTDSVYSLLVSVLILSIMILILITNKKGPYASLIAYILIIHFLFTFLMLIQRFFILLFPAESESKKQKSQRENENNEDN